MLRHSDRFKAISVGAPGVADFRDERWPSRSDVTYLEANLGTIGKVTIAILHAILAIPRLPACCCTGGG
jgi:hypothetical protein